MKLSAAGSQDPDGNSIEYRWFEYREVSALSGRFPALLSKDETGSELRVVAPRVAARAQYHVILEGRDNGTPRRFRYRRVIMDVSPR